MDDLIPFLIVLAISIVGAIGSRKKQKNQTIHNQQSETLSADDDLPDWFKRFIPEEDLPVKPKREESPAEKPVEVVREPLTVVDRPNPGKFDQFSGFISPDEREKLIEIEGERAIKPKSAVLPSDPLPKSNKALAKELIKRPLNMKEAVIYSELLNRKYV